MMMVKEQQQQQKARSKKQEARRMGKGLSDASWGWNGMQQQELMTRSDDATGMLKMSSDEEQEVARMSCCKWKWKQKWRKAQQQQPSRWRVHEAVEWWLMQCKKLRRSVLQCVGDEWWVVSWWVGEEDAATTSWGWGGQSNHRMYLRMSKKPSSCSSSSSSSMMSTSPGCPGYEISYMDFRIMHAAAEEAQHWGERRKDVVVDWWEWY
jgi:hypothetical protein